MHQIQQMKVLQIQLRIKFFLRISRTIATAHKTATSKSVMDKNILTPPPYVKTSTQLDSPIIMLYENVVSH